MDKAVLETTKKKARKFGMRLFNSTFKCPLKVAEFEI